MRDPMPKAEKLIRKQARAVRRAIRDRTTKLCPTCGRRLSSAMIYRHRKDAHGYA